MIKVKITQLLQLMLDNSGKDIQEVVKQSIDSINKTGEPHGKIEGLTYYSWRSPGVLFLSYVSPEPGDYIDANNIERSFMKLDPPTIKPSDYPWGCDKRKMTRLEYIDYLMYSVGMSADSIVDKLKDLPDEAEFWIGPSDTSKLSDSLREMMSADQDTLSLMEFPINEKFNRLIEDLGCLRDWMMGNNLKWKWGQNTSVRCILEGFAKDIETIKSDYLDSLERIRIGKQLLGYGKNL